MFLFTCGVVSFRSLAFQADWTPKSLTYLPLNILQSASCLTVEAVFCDSRVASDLPILT